MRILVVDDSEDSRELTEAVLLSAGYDNVAGAESAGHAFEMLGIGSNSTAAPAADLLLLDIVMPEMDGIEACARIRNDPRYADHPIIMVTSLGDMESLGNAFVAGATDYITKPINRIELVARVRAALKLKAELDRRQAREGELMNFLSSWGDRRANVLVDETTGLLVGEVAEAYLIAATRAPANDSVSTIALMLDRFDVYRTAYGEHASQAILAQVAQSILHLSTRLGMIAASYRNGVVVLVGPQCDAHAAAALAETIKGAIAKLRLRNPEAIKTDFWTTSIVAITGRVKDGLDGAKMLTKALFDVQSIAAAGGNRVLATTI